MVSFLGTIVAFAFGILWSFTLVAVYIKYSPQPDNPACNAGGGSCSNAKVIGLIVFITFSGYWISEVIKNVIHTTICGTYGAVYYAANPQSVVRHPAAGAFKRSMTYSFGSISLGSLLVAIVQFLKQAAAYGRQAEASEGNTIMSFVFCFLQCFIGILEWAAEFFNHYAYTEIALFGKAYIPAAKDTWHLIKDRGIDAMINDCLIDSILTMGSTAVAYLTCFLAYLYIEFTNPPYNSTGAYTPVFLAFAFLIGLQITNIAVVALKSGTATLFVALAENPEAMRGNNPYLFDRIVQTYPRVQWGIHS